MIPAINVPKTDRLYKYSDPVKAQKKATRYIHRTLYKSTKKEKKYSVLDDYGHVVHFGQMGYEDYTKHLDRRRRRNYLTRSKSIKGNWKLNKFSPNHLSRKILW